ncbi:hypothetical protein KAU11_04165, partial [Candidatus Babeliales bacterium]|nr:hypothetical protein [Candidatus Babeliales bacterium]
NYVLEIVDAPLRNLDSSKWPHIIGAPKHFWYKLCEKPSELGKLIFDYFSEGGNKVENIDLVANKFKRFSSIIQKKLIENSSKILDELVDSILLAWEAGLINESGKTIFRTLIDGVEVEIRVFVRTDGYKIIEKMTGLLNKTSEIATKLRLSIDTAFIPKVVVFK